MTINQVSTGLSKSTSTQFKIQVVWNYINQKNNNCSKWASCQNLSRTILNKWIWADKLGKIWLINHWSKKVVLIQFTMWTHQKWKNKILIKLMKKRFKSKFYHNLMIMVKSKNPLKMNYYNIQFKNKPINKPKTQT